MGDAAHHASALTLHRLSRPPALDHETVENGDDRFVISLPLCRGSVRLDGEGGTIYDGDVRPGMLRIMAPGERLHVQRRSRAEAMVITVPGPAFRRIASSQAYRADPSALSLVAPLTTPHPQVERLTSALLGANEIDARQRPLFLEGITLALLALAFEPRSNPVSSQGLSEAAFARCIDFADAHLEDKVDIAAWAASLGLPPGEFVRRFRNTAHVAPYTWLLNWRIDRAKAMLERSDIPLAQVAIRVGFSSQSHFSEAFRRRAGLSPGQWRKRTPQGSR